MTRNAGKHPHYRSDTAVLAFACLAALTASSVLVMTDSKAFELVLGIARPLLPLVVVVSLGFMGWRLLTGWSWIPARTSGMAGYRAALLIGLVLPVPVICVDWLGGYGQAINAPVPDALLFYPAIAVVAEFVFHVLPLAIVAILAWVIRRAQRAPTIFGIGAAVVIEPVLQFMWGRETSPVWANTYTGLHILAFNIIEVYLLRRFGILRALVFRISYYFVWHVLWGQLRLGLLFVT